MTTLAPTRTVAAAPDTMLAQTRKRTMLVAPVAIPGSRRHAEHRFCGQLGDADKREAIEALPASKPLPQKEHTSESLDSVAPRSIATSSILATKSIRHQTRSLTKLLLVGVGATLAIGWCIFDRDLGHIAVAFIFGMIGYAMIRGT
jgi:hypothetical protein